MIEVMIKFLYTLSAILIIMGVVKLIIALVAFIKEKNEQE